MKTLVVGGGGFVGAHLMKELLLTADSMDIKDDRDVRKGIKQVYETIVFLACDQKDTRAAFDYNIQMYDSLRNYHNRNWTKLIYISSAAVEYGGSWYSESKRIGERYAKLFKDWVILRPSNIYGHGDGHGAPDRFMSGKRTIYGDGEQIRDLIPVESVIMEILDCISNPDRSNKTYNISSGVGTTVNEMFKMFGKGKPSYKRTVDTGVSFSVLPPGEVA